MKNSLINITKKIIPAKHWPVIINNTPFIQNLVVRKKEKSWQQSEPTEWPIPENKEKSGLEKYEYSLFSQHGEDGILRYLFSEIGFQSKLFLEFGFGISENNSLRLVLKEGFGGVFMDGSSMTTRLFNKVAKRQGINNVKAINQFLNLENIESTIVSGGLKGEIDLLSIDVDGNDYWFWEKINCINPRVVVMEYNASFGSEVLVTVPYEPDFDRTEKPGNGFYHGASLPALEKLGKKKGYDLVGCDSAGVNAFFVRNDCRTNSLEVTPTKNAFRPHLSRLKRGFSQEDQLTIIKDMPLIHI